MGGLSYIINYGTQGEYDSLVGKYFKLGADIDLDEYQYNGRILWEPIGRIFNRAFEGHFNGDGHTISNMIADLTAWNGSVQSYTGLFAVVTDGSVSNLIIDGTCTVNGDATNGSIAGQINGSTITNCTSGAIVTGITWDTGGVIGESYANGSTQSAIESCSFYGTVNGFWGVGGILGYSSNNTTIENCTNSGNVTGTSEGIGGILGWSEGGNTSVTDSINSGEIYGTGYVGGIAGSISGTEISEISDCYNIGDISSTGKYVGGIAGYSCTIIQSYNTGAVSSTIDGDAYIGGITGYAGYNVEGCYNIGDILSSGDQVGGIAGYSDDDIYNCYNMGNIALENDAYYVGGIVGFSSGDNIYNCFNTGSINASEYSLDEVGGIVGYSEEADIEHCVSMNELLNTGDGTYVARIRGNYDSGDVYDSYAWNGMRINGAFVEGGGADDENGEDISKADINNPTNWLSYFDVASESVGYGNWTFAQYKLPQLTVLDSDNDFEMPEHLAYNALSSGSSATKGYEAGDSIGIDIDSQLNVFGVNIAGAKVIISNYDADTDTVTWNTDDTGVGIYLNNEEEALIVDGTTATITFEGEASAANYQQVLRSVHLVTTATSGSKTFSFSLGESGAYSGHYYEYVDTGENLYWSEARVLAEHMEFGGQSGYLATIQSEEENEFIASKLGADGWIGAYGTMNGGVKEWQWVTDPDEAVASAVFFAQTGAGTGTTAEGAYSNWNGGEPNGNMFAPEGTYDEATEWCGEIYSTDGNGGTWNDLPDSGFDGIEGYIVEFSIVPSELVVTKTVTITATPTHTSHDNDPEPIAEVNGEPAVSGTVSTTTDASGRKTTEIVIDERSLEKQLERAERGAVVTVPFTGSTDVAIAELNGQMLKDMENRTTTLVVETQTASYKLPADVINIDAVLAQLGTNVTLADVKVQITIAEPRAATVQIVQQAASMQNLTLVVPAVDFEISCTYRGETVDVSKFNTYVERMVVIPEGVDPSKITTGIVVNSEETTRVQER